MVHLSALVLDFLIGIGFYFGNLQISRSYAKRLPEQVTIRQGVDNLNIKPWTLSKRQALRYGAFLSAIITVAVIVLGLLRTPMYVQQIVLWPSQVAVILSVWQIYNSNSQF